MHATDVTPSLLDTRTVMASIGNLLHCKFRVVSPGDVAGWDAAKVAVATMLGLRAHDLVENSMLVQHPLRHTVAVQCRGSSPCMFLSGAGPKVDGGVDSRQVPEGDTQLARGVDYGQLPGVHIVPHLCRQVDGVGLYPSASTGGYTVLTVGKGSTRRVTHVHRFVLWALRGPPPDDGHRVAMHLCDNKACLNPCHLVWGTRSMNVAGHAPKQGASGVGYTHLLGTPSDLREVLFSAR